MHRCGRSRAGHRARVLPEQEHAHTRPPAPTENGLHAFCKLPFGLPLDTPPSGHFGGPLFLLPSLMSLVSFQPRPGPPREEPGSPHRAEQVLLPAGECADVCMARGHGTVAGNSKGSPTTQAGSPVGNWPTKQSNPKRQSRPPSSSGPPWEAGYTIPRMTSPPSQHRLPLPATAGYKRACLLRLSGALRYLS